MIGIIAGIVGMVAAGCLLAYAIIVTIKWLRNKIKEKLAAKNVSKVAYMDIEKLIDECDNTMSMKEFNDFVDNGYTHVMASVDDNGQIVGQVDIIKDKNDTIDEEVEQLLGRKGMVVVTA